MLLEDFDGAAHQLLEVKPDPMPGMALLLAEARHQIDRYWHANASENRCDAEELTRVLGRVLAVIDGSAEMKPKAQLVAALSAAVERGWLEEDRYDSWVPGMASGTGWRDSYSTTSLGRRWLKNAVGFSPVLEATTVTDPFEG